MTLSFCVSCCILCNWLGTIPFPHLLRRKKPVTDTSGDFQNFIVCVIIRASTSTYFRRSGDGESSVIQNLKKNATVALGFFSFLLLPQELWKKGYKVWKEISHWSSKNGGTTDNHESWGQKLNRYWYRT